MERKMLGIGVAGIAFLLLSVATLVPVTATPTVVNTSSKAISSSDTNLKEADVNPINKVFLKHKDDLAEINAYVENYIAEHGGIDKNFVLPADLQEKSNDIVNEIRTKNENGPLSLALGPGKNDFKVKFYWWGYYAGVWLNHHYTQLLDEYANWGGYGIAVLISLATGEALAGIMIGLANAMISQGIGSIQDLDQGSGIYAWMIYYYIPWKAPVFWVSPQ